MSAHSILAKTWLAAAVLVSGGLQAQQSLNTAGGNAAGNAGSVSYSIGQPFMHTHTSPTGSMAEGVQQPYEIMTVSAIAEAAGVQLFMTAYPNPTAGNLTLDMQGMQTTDLRLSLMDMQGRVLRTERITDPRTVIPMRSLEAAVYFVKIIRGDAEVKTFKIVKTH